MSDPRKEPALMEVFDEVWMVCSNLTLDYVTKSNLMDELLTIKQALSNYERVIEELKDTAKDTLIPLAEESKREFAEKLLKITEEIEQAENIDPSQAIYLARKIIKDNEGDQEGIHFYLDELLLKILKQHGYKELVEIFKKQPRWYA